MQLLELKPESRPCASAVLMLSDFSVLDKLALAMSSTPTARKCRALGGPHTQPHMTATTPEPSPRRGVSHMMHCRHVTACARSCMHKASIGVKHGRKSPYSKQQTTFRFSSSINKVKLIILNSVTSPGSSSAETCHQLQRACLCTRNSIMQHLTRCWSSTPYKASVVLGFHES